MDIPILPILEVVAIVAFSVPGAAVAIDTGLDIFGVVFIGVITALGGGVLRDLILGIFPPVMFTYKIYVIASAITSLIIFFLALWDKERYFRNIERVDRIVNVFDAVGIGLFSVTSIQRCFQYGYGDNAFLCIMMAMITCIGGSLLRDLICQRLPAILRKRIYALATIAGGMVYYYMYRYGCDINLSMFCGAATTVVIRLLATRYKWNMPRIVK